MNGGGVMLQELRLWGCGLGNDGAESVLENLPSSVKTIWLDDNDIFTISPDLIPPDNTLWPP